MNKVFEKILERLDEASVLRANSKEYFNNPQNGEYVDDVVLMKDAIKIVNEVAEEYNGGWIPCSERLPEAGKRYLVSAIWKDKDFEKSAVYDAVYGSDGLWHSYNYEPVSYKVIAWQPLPEPFKERD